MSALDQFFVALLATKVALADYKTPSDKIIKYVVEKGGTYTFNASSTATADADTIIAPIDNTAGRWVFDGLSGGVSSSFIAVGTAPVASVGDIRGSKSLTLKVRRADNLADVSILTMDGADGLTIGATANIASILYSVKSGGLHTFAIAGNNVAAIGTAGGGAVATTGTVRLPKSSSIVARDNAGSTDLTLLSTDSSDVVLIGGGAVARIHLGPATVQWPDGISSPTLKIGIRTSDAAPQALTIEPQAPKSDATGANRKPGDLVVALAAPTNGGTTLPSLQVKHGGTLFCQIGRYDSAANYGAYWAGNTAPSQQNFVFLGDASGVSYLNVPTNGAIHLSFNGSANTGLSLDQNVSRVTCFLNAFEFEGQYSSAVSSQTFTATPTFNWNLSNNHVMAAATANITSVTLSNPRSGAIYTIMLTQDGTGNRTITWPAATRFEGTDNVFGVTANNVTVWTFLYDGTVHRCLSKKIHAT